MLEKMCRCYRKLKKNGKILVNNIFNNLLKEFSLYLFHLCSFFNLKFLVIDILLHYIKKYRDFKYQT